MPAARNSTLNACTATDRPAIRSSTSVTTRQSSCLAWMEQTSNEMQRASRLIGDPRNDSHMLMSQLHLALLKAHNAFVDEARLIGAANVFDEAARELQWHYQWIVLNEFLPALVGRTHINQVLREVPQWFRPDRGGFIPLEFADAAYRYGQTMPSRRAGQDR